MEKSYFRTSSFPALLWENIPADSGLAWGIRDTWDKYKLLSLKPLNVIGKESEHFMRSSEFRMTMAVCQHKCTDIFF